MSLVDAMKSLQFQDYVLVPHNAHHWWTIFIELWYITTVAGNVSAEELDRFQMGVLDIETARHLTALFYELTVLNSELRGLERGIHAV